MSIITHMSEEGEDTLTVNCTISTSLWNKEYNKVIEAKYQNAKIPGFRDNESKFKHLKKQQSVMDECYPYVEEELYRHILKEYYSDVDFKPIGNAYSTEYKHENNQHTFSFKTDKYPKVDIGDIKDPSRYNLNKLDTEFVIKLKNDVSVAIEDKIRNTIVLKKADREVRAYDVVTLKLDTEDSAIGSQDSINVDLDNSPILTNIASLVVGKKKSSTIEGVIKWSVDENSDATKDVDAIITILDIHYKEKVSLVELAKKHNYDDEKAYKKLLEDMKFDLEVGQVEKIYAESIVNTICNGTGFKVPENLINLTIEDMIKKGDVKFPEGHHRKFDPVEDKEIVIETYQEAHSRVKESIVVDVLSNHLDITVSDEELLDVLKMKTKELEVTDENLMNMLKGGLFDDIRMDQLKIKIGSHIAFELLEDHLVSKEARDLMKL